MPTLANGGALILALILLGVALALGIATHRAVAGFECLLTDGRGFPCGVRFTLRESYEDHLELCHGLTEAEARQASQSS